MLEIRPQCEHCNTKLPANSTSAHICSFECTFCTDCVTNILGNICPNCGGGFTKRPVRPSTNWKNGNFLGEYPASTTPKYRPADIAAHTALVAKIGNLPPEER